MMRVDGMRQFREKALESGTNLLEFEYVLAAFKYVGSITHCDIPVIQNAARRVQCGPEMLAMGDISVGNGMPREFGQEYWIRGMIQEHFDRIIAKAPGDAGEQRVQALRDLLFKKLYPM
jgi:hypothetical protein